MFQSIKSTLQDLYFQLRSTFVSGEVELTKDRVKVAVTNREAFHDFVTLWIAQNQEAQSFMSIAAAAVQLGISFHFDEDEARFVGEGYTVTVDLQEKANRGYALTTGNQVYQFAHALGS